MYQVNTFNLMNNQDCNTLHHSGYSRRTINGKIVGCSKCVGYCTYDGHPGFLTETLREEHSCREKECCCYISKPRRDRSEQKKEKLFRKSILQAAQAFTADYEGMRVISISNCDDGCCTLRYVTISNCYPIPSIEQTLSDNLGLSVRLDKINCDFEKAAEMIFSR